MPNIKDRTQIIKTSSAGQIEGATWNPNAGHSRKVQLEIERVKEMAAYEERKVFEDPTMIRFLKLEGAVADLQAKVQSLTEKLL